MAICVGIWSRNTETQIGDDMGSRLFLLEQAARATHEKALALASRHSLHANIKSIFVAPEYMFSAERQDPTAARAVSDTTRSALKALLQEMSLQFPGMLLVPGTIIYKIDLQESPLRGAWKKAEALRALDVSLVPKDKKVYPVADLQLSSVEKKRYLAEGQVTRLIRNRCYVFKDGSTELVYGKKADMNEAVGSDKGDERAPTGIFIPGLKASQKSIGGINFGFEICWEHANGVLKSVVGTGTKPDIQIICSAFIENQTLNMVVRPGGFVLHASSRQSDSGVFYKPMTGQNRQPPRATPPQGLAGGDAGKIERLGESVVGGSPLTLYLIDYV